MNSAGRSSEHVGPDDDATPLVSVIVPSYNHARFLPARFESIQRQTFQDYELIVLDDASTDGSLAILEEYAGRIPMRLVVNAANSGSPFLQWQKGVSLARGKYIWIAESDDEAKPGFLAAMVAKLEANPRVGLAFSQSLIVDGSGNDRGTWVQNTDWIDQDHWRSDYVGSGREECAKYLLWANTIPNASAVVLRRDVFQRQMRGLPRMRLCGDWLAWARVLAVSDIAFVAEPLNYHREHGTTVRSTLRLGKHFREYTFVWKYIARVFRDDPAVRERLHKAVAFGWSLQKKRLQPEDDWFWFLSLVRHLWAISPRTLNEIFRSYLQHRLEGVELGFGFRRFSNLLRNCGGSVRRRLQPQRTPAANRPAEQRR
jgi:glycosyltransferase involved in cell wall biosynthesis